MPKATEVAAALRILADSLNSQPETNIPIPRITFFCSSKEVFKNTVKLMPRPLKKHIFLADSNFPDLHVEHVTEEIDITVSIPQKAVCTLVEPARPAKYHCESILSPEEEATLTEEVL